jgi:CheY-like chemotaxis protein
VVEKRASGFAVKRGPILVVDDYADARANLREMLEELGQDVVEATNGQEAFDFLLSHSDVRVQLILLDLEMPTMTGWELLVLLKSYMRLSTIPVLIVSRHTSYLRPKDHEVINGYIEAPADMPQLRALVETIIRH